MSIKFSSIVFVIMILFVAKLSLDNMSSAEARDQVNPTVVTK